MSFPQNNETKLKHTEQTSYSTAQDEEKKNMKIQTKNMFLYLVWEVV